MDYQDYLNVKLAIRNEENVTNDLIDSWLTRLMTIYNEVAKKYKFTDLDDMCKYIHIKEQRNADSHFDDQIKIFQLTENNNNLDQFLNSNFYLRNRIDNKEASLLAETFQRYCANISTNPR